VLRRGLGRGVVRVVRTGADKGVAAPSASVAPGRLPPPVINPPEPSGHCPCTALPTWVLEDRVSEHMVKVFHYSILKSSLVLLVGTKSYLQSYQVPAPAVAL